MKCIDAIEGTVKCIITELHRVFVEDGLDDTEYIRNVKTVIEGTDAFIQQNREILCDPQMLKDVLYSFSKDLWLTSLKKNLGKESVSEDNTENNEYYDYYFDYIYNHGVYPL